MYFEMMSAPLTAWAFQPTGPVPVSPLTYLTYLPLLVLLGASLCIRLLLARGSSRRLLVFSIAFSIVGIAAVLVVKQFAAPQSIALAQVIPSHTTPCSCESKAYHTETARIKPLPR